jgi:hypothetical protein
MFIGRKKIKNRYGVREPITIKRTLHLNQAFDSRIIIEEKRNYFKK